GQTAQNCHGYLLQRRHCAEVGEHVPASQFKWGDLVERAAGGAVRFNRFSIQVHRTQTDQSSPEDRTDGRFKNYNICSRICQGEIGSVRWWSLTNDPTQKVGYLPGTSTEAFKIIGLKDGRSSHSWLP